jgi:hypothetical protein
MAGQGVQMCGHVEGVSTAKRMIRQPGAAASRSQLSSRSSHPPEGAELAGVAANVGVVDVSIDSVADCMRMRFRGTNC